MFNLFEAGKNVVVQGSQLTLTEMSPFSAYMNSLDNEEAYVVFAWLQNLVDQTFIH